jgi:hypothetical protein
VDALIVRVTARQWAAIIDHLPHGWLFDWVSEEGRIEEVGKKVEVWMLPDAWRAVADELIATWFTTGSIRKASAPLFDGVRHIVKETNARQTHPAFAGKSVIGRQTAVLPAWEADGDRNFRTLYSPWIPSQYEMDPRKLVRLWPGHFRHGAEWITEWHVDEIDEPTAAAYARFIKARPAAAGSPK